MAAASGDIIEGLRRWSLWSFLALDSIRNSYRRTVIGPWWLTLQNVLYIAGTRHPLQRRLRATACVHSCRT